VPKVNEKPDGKAGTGQQREFTIEDCYADPSDPPPKFKRSRKMRMRIARSKGGRNPDGGEFLHLYGPVALNRILVERKALPVLALLQTIHRHQTMRRRSEIVLDQDVWADAGDPSRQLRATLLAHLRKLSPDLVVIGRGWGSCYRVKKGPSWLTIEKAGEKKRAAD
jgi:hypothetical protein